MRTAEKVWSWLMITWRNGENRIQTHGQRECEGAERKRANGGALKEVKQILFSLTCENNRNSS